MPKIKVLIEVEQKVWEVMPEVARHLKLPIDAKLAETAGMVFDELVFDAYLTISWEKDVAESGIDVQGSLSELLDPNVTVPLALQIVEPSGELNQTLEQLFDELEKEDPNDIYVKAVLAKTENTLLWRCALASVYRIIHGDERREPGTWILIEKTYRMLSRSGDPLKDSMGKPLDK